VQDDLRAEGLGSVDERGRFYVTVPGDIERLSVPMNFEEWEANGRRAA
jgi:hypothetical protein